MDKHLLDIVQSTFFNILIVGAVLSMLYGLWLLIAPASAQLLNNKINKNFSMRKYTKFLETPISIDSLFYRYAKLVGSFLMLGSACLLYVLLWQFDYVLLAKTLPNLNSLMWEWLLQAFQIFFVIISVIIFFMGFLIVIRPSLLKPLENKANKWVSSRNKFQFMSKDIVQAEQWLERFPRQFGAVIFICGSIVLLSIDKFNF